MSYYIHTTRFSDHQKEVKRNFDQGFKAQKNSNAALFAAQRAAQKNNIISRCKDSVALGKRTKTMLSVKTDRYDKEAAFNLFYKKTKDQMILDSIDQGIESFDRLSMLLLPYLKDDVDFSTVVRFSYMLIKHIKINAAYDMVGENIRQARPNSIRLRWFRDYPAFSRVAFPYYIALVAEKFEGEDIRSEALKAWQRNNFNELLFSLYNNDMQHIFASELNLENQSDGHLIDFENNDYYDLRHDSEWLSQKRERFCAVELGNVPDIHELVLEFDRIIEITRASVRENALLENNPVLENDPLSLENWISLLNFVLNYLIVLRLRL